MSDLYFNEESDYSEQNTSDNEDFRSTILQPFKFEPEQKKMPVNESHEKETTGAVVHRYSFFNKAAGLSETKPVLELPICYIVE